MHRNYSVLNEAYFTIGNSERAPIGIGSHAMTETGATA